MRPDTFIKFEWITRSGIRLFAVLSLVFIFHSGPVWADPASKPDAGGAPERKEDLHWGKDPFNHQKKSKPSGSGSRRALKLEGIIYHSGNGLAIINNTLLRNGDRIDGRKVVAILEDRVVLKGPSGSLVLKMDGFSSDP